MNAPDALQNIRSKHPVAYVVLYLFVGWALLVVITHAIAFGAELLIASSDLGRPSRACLLECDIRGTTLHMSEIQMRPDKEISS